MKPGYLILENGAVFSGKTPRPWTHEISAEVVFTTGMCGYVESLTDPSYTGQILVFTYPLIGNYGVCGPAGWESAKISVSGVVVDEACIHWSHPEGVEALHTWLERYNVPLLTEVDTRALTKQLRKQGTMLGVLAPHAQARPQPCPPLYPLSCVQERSVVGTGKLRIIAVDCGMKESMMRQLLRYPLEIVRVPHNYDYTHEEFDGVFLSNGPGDPQDYTATIEILKKAFARKRPIFGVCLGSQMMALAAGGNTYKLPFGHRGHNQPCRDLETGRCYITSQNHGFAVDGTSLPEEWRVTFRNLNDGSVEGIAHNTLPFSAVQFHPEAAPGPTDVQWLFERFYTCLQGKYSS